VGKGIHSFAGSRLTLLKLGLASVELSSKVTGSQTIHMHSYVSLIELLDLCILLHCLLLEKDHYLLKVLHLFETGSLGANFYWGRRRVSQRW